MGTVFMLAGQFSISRKCPISSLGKVWFQELTRIDEKIFSKNAALLVYGACFEDVRTEEWREGFW